MSKIIFPLSVFAALIPFDVSARGVWETATRSAADQPSRPALADDFEAGGGALGEALLRDRHIALVENEGVGGSRALRVTYVGYEGGSERVVRILSLGERGSEYTLTYDVKFPRGFKFVLGGKLHGLGPARNVSGGQRMRPDGWSARAVWRENGGFGTYTYHQDQLDRFGDFGTAVQPFAFEEERYYAVSLHVKLNAPATASNGSVRLYVDGALIETHEALRLRSVDTNRSLISHFLFSTFHGGGDPSWAPKSTTGQYTREYAFFDNIAVHPGERIRSRPGADFTSDELTR